MRVVDRKNKVSLGELQEMAANMFSDLDNAVADVGQNIMVIDAELHADEETLLIECRSDRANLQGINLYPGLESDDFVEYDSMINLRTSRGNRGRGVEDPGFRSRIREIVTDLVTPFFRALPASEAIQRIQPRRRFPAARHLKDNAD